MTTRSNSDTTITFLATRKLTAGTSLNEEITLVSYLSSFERSTEKGAGESKTIDGTISSVLNYYAETYRCESPAIDAADNGVWEMFLASTMNKESFTITNRDEADREMTVQRSGTFSRERVQRLFAMWRYSFQVRELQ